MIQVPEGKSGAWEVRRFTVNPVDATVSMFRVAFHGGRGFVPAGEYTRLTHSGQIIMSDTPDEIADHSFFISMARRAQTILINGLGLGVVLSMILESDMPEDVTVVEQSEGVMNLVAPSFASDKRVSIIHADAFKYKPPKGKRYDVVWHDIWDSICSDNLPEMHTLHRKYGRRCNWQGSWCRSLCERSRGRR